MPSISQRKLPRMNEAQSSEVERVLLHIGHACDRAKRGAEAVTKDGDDPGVAKALTDAANELSRVYRQLTQATYYAVDGERPVARGQGSVVTDGP